MISSIQGFPKSARLRKSKDFAFRPYEWMETDHFKVFFTRSGKGRLGVTLSKKCLKSAAARNRIRRLLREGFRKKTSKFNGLDVNWVGRRPLSSDWKQLNQAQIDRELESFLATCQKRGQSA